MFGLTKLTDHLYPKEEVELEKAECCPPSEQFVEPYPVGFFHALSRSGKEAGFGFYCDRCHILYQIGLEDTDVVKHCGKRESVRRFAKMETLMVGNHKGGPTKALRFITLGV